MTGKSTADSIINRYFLRTDGPYGHYLLPDHGDLDELGQEVLRDALYRYELVRADDDATVTVQLYLGVSQSGGWLWEQELRTLLRVGSLRHVALPEVVTGGHRPAANGAEPGFAFVVTIGNGEPLSDEPDAPAFMKQRPIEALRALSVLADALAKLHAMGIIHRNLWPGTIEVSGDPESSLPPLFRVVRFEMSRMVENLLQGGIAESAQRTSEIRRQLIAKEKAALAYCPPERVQFLFPEGDELIAFGESERSDVYGLGVIAYEWFLGPVPFDPETLDLTDHKRVREAVGSLNAELRRNIRLAHQTLDADLRRLLESMLEPHMSSRPVAGEVVADINQNYDAMIESWTAAEADQPSYLVAFMPKESTISVYKWNWIENHPIREEGKQELGAFIEDDLKTARLAYSPDGAKPFVQHAGNPKAKEETKYVLVGSRGIWFCKRYQSLSKLGHPKGPPSERILLIKYVVPRDSVRGQSFLSRLSGRTPVRHVPEIETVPSDNERRLEAKGVNRPSWMPLLNSIHPREGEWDGDEAFRQAFDWLLEYQGAELRTRQYAYRRVDDGGGREATLVFDADRDDERIRNSPMATRFAQSVSRRPLFGDFFAELAGADGDTTIEAKPETRRPLEPKREQAKETMAVPAVPSLGKSTDKLALGKPVPGRTAKGKPVQGGRAARENDSGKSSRGKAAAVQMEQSGFGPARMTFKKRLTDDAIVVRRLDDSPPIPEYGWLSAADDHGSWVALHRQIDARGEMLDNRLLLSQLRHPTTIHGFGGRWTHAGEGLRGAGRKAVQDMLTAQPFFALQGPPGTGKTEVAARAIAASLDKDRTGRLLISAQSNFALDNLAHRALRHMGILDTKGNIINENPDVIPLRIQSASALRNNRIDEDIRKFELHKMTQRRVKMIQKRVREDLKERRDGYARILTDWVEDLNTCSPELADRLSRAANLVFATCSTATQDSLGGTGSGTTFDWVIIEEAAKAWPTELAIPLTRGRRWTLIGDHHQLPAHRRTQIAQFLAQCVGDPDPAVALDDDQRANHLRVFDMFAELFQPVDDERHGLQRPVQTLTEQFRMRRPIAEMISRVFYPKPGAERDATGLFPGLVETPLERHDTSGLVRPPSLVQPALVWFDTNGVPDCHEDGAWFNEGEAGIVNALLEQMRPALEEEPLKIAVLTPYRQQADRLRAYGAAAVHEISTVHAFQGREADIVVVSLVRDRMRQPGRPLRNFGYLTERELINVMLSRARRLLVLVGNLRHFEQAEDFWSDVCLAVRTLGKVRSAGEVKPS